MPLTDTNIKGTMAHMQYRSRYRHVTTIMQIWWTYLISEHMD